MEADWNGLAGLELTGKKVKDSLSSKFSLTVDSSSTPNTATLQGQNMQPGDSAVYYCARDAQHEKLSGRTNKNPSPTRCYNMNPPEGEL